MKKTNYVIYHECQTFIKIYPPKKLKHSHFWHNEAVKTAAKSSSLSALSSDKKVSLVLKVLRLKSAIQSDMNISSLLLRAGIRIMKIRGHRAGELVKANNQWTWLLYSIKYHQQIEKQKSILDICSATNRFAGMWAWKQKKGSVYIITTLPPICIPIIEYYHPSFNSE